MDKPVMFNRRLNKYEFDTWLNLLNETGESGFRDRDLVRAFLSLPESITFVSSLENNIIGGTSIYRDRTRLAMVLASVAIHSEFRDSAAYQIIKSSMPFFKTVAIRDVDALVPLDVGPNSLGFPLSFELDSWVIEVIKRMGFAEVQVLQHYSFSLDDGSLDNPIMWTSEVNESDIGELIWNQSKPMGLTNSLVWLARDFALDRECLVTITVQKQTVAVAGFWQWSDTLSISPFVTDPSKLSWDKIAESLIAEATSRGLKRIEIPLIGEGQRELIQILDEKCSNSSCRKLSLLRKPL